MDPHVIRRSIYDKLYEKYGPVMDAKALCEVLHYPTPRSLRTAKTRGKLPYTPLDHRGVYASTAEIAELLMPSYKDHPESVVCILGSIVTVPAPEIGLLDCIVKAPTPPFPS